MLFLEWLVWFI